MKYYSVSSKTDAFELDASILPVLKRHECSECKRDYLPPGIDIPVTWMSTGSMLSTFWNFRIGIISVEMREVLSGFGWGDAFDEGYLSYKGGRSDAFRTFAGRKEIIPLWGGPGSIYMRRCGRCGTKDYSSPAGKKLFCTDSLLEGLVLGESTAGIVLREDAREALPARMRKKLNIFEIFPVDERTINDLRRETVVWDSERKVFLPFDETEIS